MEASTSAAPNGAPAGGLDPDSAEWIRRLGSPASGPGGERDRAVGQLHDLLLKIARSEIRRRGTGSQITGPELDDVAHHAAADALLSVMRKLDQFRGESRFTTWAYKFVIFEVSTKLGRHFWRRPGAGEPGDWEHLPDRFGVPPEERAEAQDLLAALRAAVETSLTDRQRHVFEAIVVHGLPLDALVAQLGTNRNALYKVMFDARSKLRQELVASGHLEPGRGTPT